MIRKLLIWVLPIALLLAACGPAVITTPQPNAVTESTQPSQSPTKFASIDLTDSLGREIKLASPARRVVSLAPSNTEILFAIGAGPQVVGRDELSDYPAQVASVQSVGGSMGNFSTEAIVALKPDLVLVAEISPPELVKTLEGLGLTVFYMSNPTTLDGMYANLETVGRLTGHVDDTNGLIQSLKARVATVDSKLAGISVRPSVFYELDATDASKPYTAGPGTFIDTLIQRAGGVNVASTLKDQYPQISLEELVLLNPEIILLSDAAYGETPEKVAMRSGWGTLAAVKNGRLYPFDYHLLSLPGPRLVDGLEQLAKLLHPELFK